MTIITELQNMTGTRAAICNVIWSTTSQIVWTDSMADFILTLKLHFTDFQNFENLFWIQLTVATVIPYQSQNLKYLQ
jgi:hypothetical protein